MSGPFDGIKLRKRYKRRSDKVKPEADTRTCVHCKQDLPLSDFYTSHQEKDCGNFSRYKKYCKKCYCAGKHYKLTKGISYKQALPPERWDDMRRFLATMATCADVAEKSGVEPDVMQFMRTYREVKGRI